MHRNYLLLIIGLFFLVSCSPEEVPEVLTLANFEDPQGPALPFVPDTDEYPVLHFQWSYPLSRADVFWAGYFGIIEGTLQEVATELELHTNTWHDPVYALSDGVVVQIREKEDPIEEGEVESVWIRYGRNAIVKYVHVYNPQKKVGDIVRVGDIIGYTVRLPTSDGHKGFYEIELRLREADGDVYIYPFVEYCDESCDLIKSFYADETLTRRYDQDLGPTPWKVKDRVPKAPSENPYFDAQRALSRLPNPIELAELGYPTEVPMP